ncbi:MAG: PilZ domain-containing protein [Candidatus Omnitrophota bacterium]|jgi:hypothetical protein
MENERRRSIRIKGTLLIQYSKDNIIWDISPIKDFSETGTKIITRMKFFPGDKLKLRVRIPLKPLECLEFYGKIIDCSESSSQAHITRIEFLDLNDEQKSLIQNYINKLLKK